MLVMERAVTEWISVSARALSYGTLVQGCPHSTFYVRSSADRLKRIAIYLLHELKKSTPSCKIHLHLILIDHLGMFLIEQVNCVYLQCGNN